jgi:hypothetical protein
VINRLIVLGTGVLVWVVMVACASGSLVGEPGCDTVNSNDNYTMLQRWCDGPMLMDVSEVDGDGYKYYIRVTCNRGRSWANVESYYNVAQAKGDAQEYFNMGTGFFQDYCPAED